MSSKTARRRHRKQARELIELQRTSPAAFAKELLRLEHEWLQTTISRANCYGGRRAFQELDAAFSMLSMLGDSPETRRAKASLRMLETYVAKVIAGEWTEILLLDHHRLHRPKEAPMNILRPLAIVFLLVVAAMTGACATAKPSTSEKDQETLLREQRAHWEGEVRTWSADYARALTDYQAAESAPDIAKAVGTMKQLAESAPSRAAKERATQDVCSAAAAAGDAAILTTFDCTMREPLRRLLR